MAKTPTAKTEKPKSDKPKTGGIFAPITPSAELGAIVGTDKLPRSEVISKVWAYIKKHDLQNPKPTSARFSPTKS